MNFSLQVFITRFNPPLTNITWTHEGSSVLDRVETMESSSPDQTLTIVTLLRTAAIPIDAGSYVVTAANIVGSTDFIFNVIITGK